MLLSYLKIIFLAKRSHFENVGNLSLVRVYVYFFVAKKLNTSKIHELLFLTLKVYMHRLYNYIFHKYGKTSSEDVCK